MKKVVKNILILVIVCVMGLIVLVTCKCISQKSVEKLQSQSIYEETEKNGAIPVKPYSELLYQVEYEMVSEIKISGHIAYIKNRTNNESEYDFMVEIPGQEQFKEDVKDQVNRGRIKVVYEK